MFCTECGTQLPAGAIFCPNCGTGVGQAAAAQGGAARQQTESGQAAQQTGTVPPVMPARHRHFPFGTIVAAAILVLAVWMLFNNDSKPVRDLKNVVFTHYDVGDSLERVVNQNMSHVKWSSEKVDKETYYVTVKGVENMYDALIEATFQVTYLDDMVHAVLSSAAINGESCAQSELWMVMLLIYGQLDEDTLAGLMILDAIW